MEFIFSSKPNTIMSKKKGQFEGCTGFFSGTALMITDNNGEQHSFPFSSQAQAQIWAAKNGASIA